MSNFSYTVEKNDFTNAGKVSSTIRSILKEKEINSELIRKVSVACYEAEINMIIHSNGGEINLFVDELSIQLEFKDIGPGIPDLEMAIVPGFSTATDEARALGFGAGMGLMNIRKCSEYFDIRSSSSGTVLQLKWNL